MQLGNFNITFGENYEPMLKHFSGIIYPCFVSQEFKRRDNLTNTDYLITDAELKNIDGELVFVGNYVKSTSYKITTTFENNCLKSTPGSVPTAPYSRFMIFLKNHRMVLISNEVASPNIKSFQKTVDMILKRYIRANNKGKSKDKRLPLPVVNIVDIPFSGKIEDILKEVKKINSFTLKFFPLNNDISPIEMCNDINNLIKKSGGASGNLTINSPTDKDKIIETIDKSGGLAIPQLKVSDYDGTSHTIKQESFVSVKDIPIETNIQKSDDSKIYQFAQQEDKIAFCSDDNKKLYDSLIQELNKLFMT